MPRSGLSSPSQSVSFQPTPYSADSIQTSPNCARRQSSPLRVSLSSAVSRKVLFEERSRPRIIRRQLRNRFRRCRGFGLLHSATSTQTSRGKSKRERRIPTHRVAPCRFPRSRQRTQKASAALGTRQTLGEFVRLSGKVTLPFCVVAFLLARLCLVPSCEVRQSRPKVPVLPEDQQTPVPNNLSEYHHGWDTFPANFPRQSGLWDDGQRL